MMVCKLLILGFRTYVGNIVDIGFKRMKIMRLIQCLRNVYALVPHIAMDIAIDIELSY